MIRTRFAPSPTGYLHLGGARTALFARAWARKNGGEFLLRVEDTDAARSSGAHSEAIISAMQWLGLNYDGAARFQSQNIARHRELAAQLKESGAVYEDGGALRLKTPEAGEVFFDDRVCGRLAVQNKELENPVILRADNTPTYIFASAADDMDDKITDVIRGDDHVRNTHKQLHIYAALNKTPPRFAHLPMILSSDGERLSKRHAAVDVMRYKKNGFLPAGLINYLARLSWSCGDAEVFDMDFLRGNFDFDSVQRSPARFDMAKLLWLNGEHLRKLPPEKAREAAELPGAVSDAALALILPRSETLAHIREHADYFINRPLLPAALFAGHMGGEAPAAMKELAVKFTGLAGEEWNAEAVRNAVKETVRARKLKFAQVGMPLRMMLTGREQSPDIAEVAGVLGQMETLIRMEQSLRGLLEYMNAAPD